jgi:tetratricopeptide (TPR) repeat protein
MSGLIYYTDKRRVIPQIERKAVYEDTLNVTNQIVVQKNNSKMRPILKLKEEDLAIKIEEWKQTKDFDLAGDIISQSLLQKSTKDIQEIKKYLLSNKPNDEILNWLFNTHVVKEMGIEERIKSNFNKLKIEAKDSLTWTDQAINYLEINNREESIKCIEHALKINSSLGFIVRNASRIFNLTGDNGRAIKTLKNSEYYKYDPQILSAEISFSEIENRKTLGIDLGHKLLKDKHHKNKEISELASSLGTVEYFKGEYKKSEKLFDCSLVEPNMNSLAQSLWYKKDKSVVNNLPIVEESNEIRTHRYSNEMDYEKSLEFAMKWKADEPYSIRPYRLASHLSGVLLDDPLSAFEIIKSASEKQKEIKGENYTDRDELSFNNDQAYYLLKANKIEEAREFLSSSRDLINKKNSLEEHEYVNIATLGLLAYKEKDNLQGKMLYNITMKHFRKNNYFYQASACFLNYFDEEINFVNDLEGLNNLKKELDDVVSDPTFKDLQFRKKKSLKLFDKKILALK